MKEETQAILFGLGMIIFSTSVFFILKKFFNMENSGVTACIILGFIVLFAVGLLVAELNYLIEKKQANMEKIKINPKST